MYIYTHIYTNNTNTNNTTTTTTTTNNNNDNNDIGNDSDINSNHNEVTNRKCRDSIVVRVLGWDMKVPGSIPADVNYTGYGSDTSKSLGECLRLRSNHNLNGRLAESKKKTE